LLHFQLSTVIWILSFDESCRNEFDSFGIVNILKKSQVKDNEDVRRAVHGALFILIENQNENENEKKGKGKEKENQNKNKKESKGHVMISYCQEEKEKARGIANYLQSKNIPIWISLEQMEGNIFNTMAGAIDQASVILIFLSSKYKDSQICRTEAEYAFQSQKQIICIMAEDNYQPRGWLASLLGNQIWYNLWESGVFNEEKFLPIQSELSKIFNQPITRNSTINEHQNQLQQMMNLLEKILIKIDGFESRLQRIETQTSKK